MKVEYSGDNPQFLGVLNGKPCIISKEEQLNIPEKDLSILRERKWFNYLVEKGLIKINGKEVEQTEQKLHKKPKKKKKEKTIQVKMD